MLQIATGKLFTRAAERINALRGVLHTNLWLHADGPIETAAGRLLSTSVLGGTAPLVFEMSEQIEAPESGEGVLISHGVDSYLVDFAALVSFKLNVICAPDFELVTRLTSGRRGLAAAAAPSDLVKRCFDQRVFCLEEEASVLKGFIADLIGLERKSFLAAMRAIRTYVTGLHRMGDDLDLAYTLFVAALESLAQGFDGHQGQWEDYEDAKRARIDLALAAADADTTAKVRAAVLENEYVKLAHRFRSFTLAHIASSFFREQASGVDYPASKYELPDALRMAYEMRSRYVHNLAELPRQLTIRGTAHEIVRWDGRSMLSFAGLTRLARHVIGEFIARQPKLEKEVYDYSLERAGIVQLPIAEQYWVHNVESLTATNIAERLEAFLNQLALAVFDKSAGVTDIRTVLERAATLAPQMAPAKRRAFVALHVLVNCLAAEEQQMPGWKAVVEKYGPDLNAPSVEGALVRLFRPAADWPIDEHKDMLEQHAARRLRNKGLRVHKVFEAALWLTLAERQRGQGNEMDARTSIAMAVEALPGRQKLRALEEEFNINTPIDWRDLLVPVQSEASA